MLRLNTVLLLLLQFLKVQSLCDFQTQMLCGDECISNHLSQICQCGLETMGYEYSKLRHKLSTHVCCNTKPCVNATCIDGIVQENTKPCNGQCPIDAFRGDRGPFLCETQDFRVCRPEMTMCRGVKMCGLNPDSPMTTNERLHCSTQSSQRCQGSTQALCGQVPEALYLNVGCYETVIKGQFFQCANRMDLASSMFKTPINDAKITDQSKSLNMNTQLNFNQSHLICSDDLTIPWPDFQPPWPSDQKCQLQNGDEMSLDNLRMSLILDYSFQQSMALDQIVNKTVVSSLMCQLAGTSKCSPHLDACSNTVQFCDGTAHCPNAEDEDFDRCNHTFPSTATLKCLKKDVYNVNITILAIPCNGITECNGGEDEYYCVISEINTLIAVIIGLLMMILMAYFQWRKDKVESNASENSIELNETLFERKHATEALAAEIAFFHENAEDENERRDTSGKLLQFEIEFHQSTAQAICCLKDYLDTFTFATIMNDRKPPSKMKIWIQAVKDRFKKDGDEKKENAFISVVQSALAPFSHYFDLVKDSILLAQLVISQGGWNALVANPTSFFAVVTLTLAVTTILPHILSSIRLLLTAPELLVGGSSRNGSSIWRKILLVVILPLQPLFLLIRLKMALVQRKYYSLSIFRKQLPTYSLLKYHATKYTNSILGLETTFQLIILLLLQLYATSETRTSQGLEQLFEQESILFIDPRSFLIITTIWTVISATKSYIASSSARDYFPAKSKMVLAGFAGCSLTMRVSSVILYFTPTLGLFNVLRHLQGEMPPYQLPLAFPPDNLPLGTFHFGDAPHLIWSNVSRHNYTGHGRSIPPPVSIYTYFTLEQYFMSFWIILGLQSLLIVILKGVTNKPVFKRQHWLGVTMHALENSHVPFPMEDWDELKGDVKEHEIRAAKVMIEMASVMFVNLVTNAFFLSPMIILGYFVNDRHQFLINSIGAMPEEHFAYFQIQVMIYASYGGLLLLFITQVLLYFLFNKKFHPMSEILVQDNIEEQSKVNDNVEIGQNDQKDGNVQQKDGSVNDDDNKDGIDDDDKGEDDKYGDVKNENHKNENDKDKDENENDNDNDTDEDGDSKNEDNWFDAQEEIHEN